MFKLLQVVIKLTTTACCSEVQANGVGFEFVSGVLASVQRLCVYLIALTNLVLSDEVQCLFGN
jgi:hypothetical protein